MAYEQFEPPVTVAGCNNTRHNGQLHHHDIGLRFITRQPASAVGH